MAMGVTTGSDRVGCGSGGETSEYLPTSFADLLR